MRALGSAGPPTPGVCAPRREPQRRNQLPSIVRELCLVPQGKDKGLTPSTPPYCQQACRREHLYKTARPWHTPSLPGSIPQTGHRWRLPVASGRGSFLVAPGEHASGSETGGPWPRETRKRCVSSPGLRPIRSKPLSSHLRASCLSKGISGPLEQIWVALDRQGHWLSTQEANWHAAGAGAEAKALKQNTPLYSARSPVSITPGTHCV